MDPVASPPAARRSALLDLGPRLASAVVMIVLALAALWAGGVWFGLFWLAATLAVLWEWQRIVGGERARLRLFFGTLALALAASFTTDAAHLAPDLAIGILLVGCAIVAAISGRGHRLWNIAGLVYAGLLFMSVTVLRLSIFYGWQSILWLFAVVWMTDIMAYFGGRLIGGPKLWPRVSPKKTWSGFLTGITCGAAAGCAVVAETLGSADFAVLPIFALGFVTAIVSQGGDLFESSLKRVFDVKDSSHLIPGHGGVMDRLDGFIAAATFAAGLGVIRAGILAAGNGLFQW